MNYIIDGHNLIGKIAGLSLSMADDEQRLIELLTRFSQFRHARLEVYFDGAPADQAGVRNFGRVQAHFVSRQQTADEAIRRRLRRLGKSARNWVLVTSDRSVQAAGREAHARLLLAEEFAQQLQAILQAGSTDANPVSDQPLSEQEVNEWLSIFRKRGNQK